MAISIDYVHIPIYITFFIFLSILNELITSKKHSLARITSTLLLVSIVTSCDSNKNPRVYLPSLSKNFDLRPELTFAAMTIINETSGHLFVLDKDLTIQGQIIKAVNKSKDGKEYKFNINKEYLTAKGEKILARDIKYSFQYLLTHKPEVSGVLKSIMGADNCFTKCELEGFVIEDDYNFSIRLVESDHRLIEKLASPWTIILKEDKNPVENIGLCKIPYQTGNGQIISCDEKGITVSIKDKRIFVTDIIDEQTTSKLLTNNPGDKTSPTLTILSIFGIPTSKLSEEQRIALMEILRENSQKLASIIKLRWSSNLVPKWLGFEPDPYSLPKTKKLVCPMSPIKFVLDNSEPFLDEMQIFLRKIIPCEIEFTITQADHFFDTSKSADLAMAWFTPDYLDIYNTFTPFDCSPGNPCYFDWKDTSLQTEIDKLRLSSQNGAQDKKQSNRIEKIIRDKGYAVPVAEMNWWILSPDGKTKTIHGAGLFQVKISDFM